MNFIQTFLKTEISLASDYEDTEIKLRSTKVQLIMKLLGGYDQAVAEAPVGIHKPTGEIITARLVFPYNTDIFMQRINLCANNLDSELSPKTILMKGGQVIGEAYPHTTTETFMKAHNQVMNAAQFKAVRENLRSVHHSVCDSAAENLITTAKKINLGEYADKHFVYKNGSISHFFDPEVENFEKCVTAPVKSHYLASVTFAVGSQFINVSDSTGDRYPATTIAPYILNAGTSWISFWSFCTSAGANTGNRPACVYYTGAAGFANGHTCNAIVANTTLIYGCHSLRVIRGVAPNAAIPHYPAPQTVNMYIVAACNNSNNYRNTNTFTMRVAADVVQINNYYHW